MFCFLEDAYTGCHVFSTEPLTQTAIPEQLRRSFDVSSPISIGHHHGRTLRNARNTRNIKIATNDHFARRIPYQISEQTLDVDFITNVSCADVSGQLTNCILDGRTIQLRFLETECVGSLEFAKTKVFAQLCQTCNLAVSGTKNDQGTLEGLSVTIPQRIVMSFESSCNIFFVNSLGPTASMSFTCTPMQMSSSVCTNRHGSRSS